MPHHFVARSAFVIGALSALSAFAALGCNGAPKAAASPSAGAAPGGTCAALSSHVARFAEVLEEVGEPGKPRRASYAGVLEMLLTFEHASGDLEAQLATLKGDDATMRDVLRRAGTALQQANDFARVEREKIEQSATALGPLAKEADAAYPELRAACEGKKAPRECAAVTEALKKLDGATFADQSRVAEELAGLRLTTPKVSASRDRSVAATRAIGKLVEAQSAAMMALGARWSGIEKAVSAAFEDFSVQCKSAPAQPLASAKFVAEPKPDLRKLTVLVRVKPPAGIDETFEGLADRAKDPAERAFYHARAKGAFGSGFVIVRPAAAGGTETLIITNRHVVELADRALLEQADGTSLGPADIVYTDSIHDVAVLRPAKKLPFDKGFAFAVATAKDQQGVIATGFPGMAGRPSYQTTRGYVSNESFRLEESARPLVFVQHTAPIDPGSSGGPLTDEGGHVLGVNTLKVTNREAVGLAVPSESILDTIRRSDAAESRRSSAQQRRDSSRLACLGFVGELASKKPRMLLMETMISNNLTGSEGLTAVMAIDDEGFGQLWQNDSVRAMRIATLLRVQSMIGFSGGTNALEICSDVNADDVRDILSADEVRYRVRLGNWDSREVAFRWEQGHWKLARIDLRAPKVAATSPATAPVKPAKPGARPTVPAARPAAKKK